VVLGVFILCAPAIASEREEATLFLKTSLECALPTESTKLEGGRFSVKKSANSFSGDSESFSFSEMHTETAGTTGGEAYETKEIIHVSVPMKEIANAVVKGRKVTISCDIGTKCIVVTYISNPDEDLQDEPSGGNPNDCFHEGMCRTERLKSTSSFRISACNASAAKDIKEAIEFLSGR
jgi:hypothetical protein